MRLHRQLIPLGILTAIVAIASAPPAGATVIERSHYSFSEEPFADVVCGVEVQHDIVFSGILQFRVGTGKTASAFFSIDNYKRVSTLVSESSVVTIEHDGMIVDTKATRVLGSVFEFTTIDAGQQLRIRDSTGRVVSRDVGVVRDTYRFDTLGDSTPGGTYLEQLELQVRGNRSLLPASGFDETAFCAIVRPLLV